VQAEVPLRRLWEIVRRGMKLEEVEPASAAVSTSGPAASQPMGAKEQP